LELVEKANSVGPAVSWLLNSAEQHDEDKKTLLDTKETKEPKFFIMDMEMRLEVDATEDSKNSGKELEISI